ncbi:MAG: polysaccharide biosynthesis C-terminal domain-containing protein [Fluviicola sp.]|nr:polysaccharide biosynthesis C-terminal domain-containing protein [Fluviicola sp.]
MQKKFFTNLVLVLVLNALVKPFYIIGIDAEVLKQVEASNPGSYGEYFSLLGFTFILNIFLDLGITNYNTRNIAQNSQLLKKHFSGIITLRALLSIGYMLLIFITGFFLGYSGQQFELLAILGVNQILVAFILYFRSNLAGLLLFKQDSFISILDRFLLIIICSVLLWGNVTEQAFKIEWFIYAQTFAYGVTAIISCFLVLRKTGKLKISFNYRFSWVIIRKSIPFAILILLTMTSYKTDGIMLERMLPDGKEEAAIYARGYRFFEAFNMVGYLFAGLLLPIFARLLKKKEDVSEILHFSFKLILTFAISVGVLSFFFQEEIIAWRFDSLGEELIQASKSFGMLMISFVFMCITYIFGTLLTAHGSLKALNIVALIAVGLNIILNYLIIPEYGAYGASMTSLVTQSLTAIFQIFLVFKILRLKFESKKIFSILTFSLTVIVLGYYAQQLNYHWALKYFSALLIAGVIALTSGMVSIKGILGILKEKE